MKQGGFFPELEIKQTVETKISNEKTFPETTLSNLLSDRFIDENGMLCLRMMLKKARKNGKFDRYQAVLEAEISMKKGKNTLKNNLRHALLSEIIK